MATFFHNPIKTIAYDSHQCRDVLRQRHDDSYAAQAQTCYPIMAVSIQIVAQYAQDQFYQNYRGGTDFFELKDFVFHCGTTIGALYQQGYSEKYAELRQEGGEEVVSFSHDWLAEQVLLVQKEKKETFVKLGQRAMSFPFDKSDIGYQELFSLDPFGTDLERSSITEIWQQKYYPATSRIFWWPDRDKIRFFNNGECNINQVRLLYVPEISAEMDIPDALVQPAVMGTVERMKQIEKGVVVKKSLDQNDNKILQTELDLRQLKP